MKLLCINAGSSSLKFQLFNMNNEELLISGYIEKIGLEDSFWTTKINKEKIKTEKYIANHTEAVKIALDDLIKYNVISSLDEIGAVSHRVVHGGEKYAASVLIDDEVIKHIEDMTKFAPLHHPGNLAGINALKEVLPDVPMVAVWDTAFHQTMPEKNYMYSVPYDWYEKLGVRKYGFHGTNHAYITKKMQEMLNKEDVNLIICHLGSGSSMCAVKEGKSYNTTMGLTPLDGLMMCTRSGTIDSSIIEFICKEKNLSVEKVTNILNKESGLLGIAGVSDARNVEEKEANGDKKAKLALDMLYDRVARFIVQYHLIDLEGKTDALVFTAGIGENGRDARAKIIELLKSLGVEINKEENNKIASFLEKQTGCISNDNSIFPVYVVPTNEELMMAKEATKVLKK